jgi:hypothetical protein
MESTVTNGGISFERLDEGMKYITQWTPTRIASGGCGIFALLLYDHLASLGIDQKITARIRQGYWRTEFEDNLVGYVNGENGVDNTGAMHILVYALIEGNWVYIDNDGINDSKLMETIRASDGVELTREELVDIYDNSKAWNKVFDRNCVPLIADKMEEVFSGVELHYPTTRVGYNEYTINKRVELYSW